VCEREREGERERGRERGREKEREREDLRFSAAALGVLDALQPSEWDQIVVFHSP